MEELGQLERGDRQRRQDAVAKIPVSFQYVIFLLAQS